MKTKEEILEKHYRNYKKRIAYDENVLAAMEEYAQEVVKNNAILPYVSGSLPTTKDELKKVCCEFFRYWWNEPGNNTDEGFDKWWSKRQ